MKIRENRKWSRLSPLHRVAEDTFFENGERDYKTIYKDDAMIFFWFYAQNKWNLSSMI